MIDKSKDKSGEPKRPKATKLQTLRILIIEPGNRYCRTVWCSILNGITHVLIGAVVMTVLFYSLDKKDTHALFCTFGFHFFSAEAILSLNYANGWSTPLRLRHRRFAHILLQLCGIICVLTGTILVLTSNGFSGSVHGVTGLLSAILACITLLVGPCALFKGRYLKLLHTTFGIPTFIMSSISLCCGLFVSEFKSWAGSNTIFILLGFIVFYTSFIMVSSFIRCMMRI